MKEDSTSKSAQGFLETLPHIFLFFTRLVKKNKGYYIVSLLGLTISLSAFLLSMMFINDELAYDKFHVNHERIQRVATHVKLGGVPFEMAAIQFPAAEAIKSEIPEVNEAIRIFPTRLTLESGELKFDEQIYYVDDGFFDVFTFPFIEGEASKSLSETGNIVLTRTTARKYFGSEKATGKLLKMGGDHLVVAGVIEDIPEQSHMKFDAVIPMSFQLGQWKARSGTEGRENKWFWVGCYTYLLLRSAEDAPAVQSKLPLIVTKYFPERYKEGGMLELWPLTDIHLKSHLEGELQPPGNMLYVRLFSIVAFVIMAVSAINLINLSYFKLRGRVQEVGIRKFLGQSTSRIVSQLLVESSLMGVAAFGVALICCQALIDPFNLLVQKNLYLWSTANQIIMGASFLLILVISLSAVLRPALRYGGRTASQLLLRDFRDAGSTSRARNLMIGLQVMFSFVLLVFSFIVGSQIEYFRNKDLGFDKSNIIILPMNPEIGPRFEAFRTELKANPFISDVTGSETPGDAISGWRFVPEGGSYEKPIMIPFAACDYDFFTSMKIRILSGASFQKDVKIDSLPPFMISKRAVLELGWQDDAIGKTLEIFAPGQNTIMMKGKVIGVFDDFHFESLHLPIKPLVLAANPSFPTLLMRISPEHHDEALAHAESTWKKFTNKPFEYEVLDKRLERLYSNETSLDNVIMFFTFITLYLTCYGLFAMSSLLFSSKLKEVAIRKVFGASQGTIIRQFYGRYAKFNLLAIIVGTPVCIYLSQLWLASFQYRVDLGYPLFVKAAVCILIAGLLSVSYYLIRVAVSNPVKFLRGE